MNGLFRMATSTNNYPKIDLVTTTRDKLKETMREINKDIRNNENTLYKRKGELKIKLRGNPEPIIVDSIIKEMKMLSASIVKQKKILSQADALDKKLFMLQRALKKVNRKTINNINKELNPKKPSILSRFLTKKNADNQKNKTLNNLKNILTKKGIQGLNLTNINNFNSEKVTVNEKNIEEEFNKFMQDVEALKKTTNAIATTPSSEHASYLQNMKRGIVNSEMKALSPSEFEAYLINEMSPVERNKMMNRMSPANLQKYFTYRAKINNKTLAKATTDVESYENAYKGGKSRKQRRSSSRKASRNTRRRR